MASYGINSASKSKLVCSQPPAQNRNTSPPGAAVIYVFNSAFKPTYLENVYRLLGLPPKVRVDLRYSEATNAPPVESDARVLNRDCIVCFVDRFHSGRYRYIPFRKGVVRAVQRKHGRAFYVIELADHCHATLLDEFTRQLQADASMAPRLTKNDPANGDDGLYCVEGTDLRALVTSTASSWSTAAEQLYECKAFQDPVPAFFLAELTHNDSIPGARSQGLSLDANREYQLTLHYHVSEPGLTESRKKLRVRIGGHVDRELSVGSASDRLVVPFTLPPLDFSAGAITIETSAESVGSTGGELRYTATIPFQTSALRSNLFLFGFLLLVSFLGEFRKVSWNLEDVSAWTSTGIEFLKFAVVVWAVFKYRGNLKLPGL